MGRILLRLVLLLSTVRRVDLRILRGIEFDKLNATIDGAKAKFSSAEYLYLYDPSPGEYFDSIALAAKGLMSVFNETTVSEMKQVFRTFGYFFEDASAKTGDQGAPFGTRDCRLLPNQFKFCRVEPRIAETMSGIWHVFRYTKFAWEDHFADLHKAVSNQCDGFNIDSAYKMVTTLTGEQCDKGPSEDGSMEHDMQRRMMQYAEENGFEGGNENKCLHMFVARFTRSSQAARIFKTAVDKYLLATTTVQAFCTVFQQTHSEDESRAKAVQAHTTLAKSLARVQLNGSAPWTCEDTRSIQSKIDADVSSATLPPLDYFDNISTVAGYSAIVLQASIKDDVIQKAKVLKKAYKSLFDGLSAITDAQAAPFGLNECWLLPAELSDNGILPIMSAGLSAMLAAIGDYDRAVEACETSSFDDTLKKLRTLMGQGCENGLGQNGTTEAAMQQSMVRYAKENHFSGAESENNCLHLFVARYTTSSEAVHLFKKSFDKYLLSLVTVQAICSAFTSRCNEDAYRQQVIDTHARFAASLERTSSFQLNDTNTWNKCDDIQEQKVTIDHVKTACQRIKSLAVSDTYFLKDMTVEEFESMAFETAEALTDVHKEAYRSFHGASTPRKKELHKRALSAVLDQMKDLMAHLAGVRRELSLPFGDKDDGLLPSHLRCDYVCQGAVFAVYKLFKKVEDNLNWAQNRLNSRDIRTLHVCQALYTRATLKKMNEFVAPGCQNASVMGDYDETERWRKGLLGYAMTHGFEGCEDNKCLLVFIARYTNRSHDALQKLQYTLNKYAYLSVFLQSFCDSYYIGDEAQNEERNETIKLLRSLKKGLDLLSNLSNRTEKVEPCRQTSGNTTSANRTSEFDHAWLPRVNAYAKDVITSETDRLQPKSWEDRQGLHEAVAKGIVERLRRDQSMEKYIFETLAYLPYVDHERCGFIAFPKNSSVVRNEYKLVNYVASRRVTSNLGSNVTGNWASIANNAKRILEFIFSYRDEANLTRRLEQASNRFGPFLTEAGFTTMVALRCGYELVWYELGYRYFPAGYATGNHTLITNVGYKYADKCGQLIFL